MKKKEETIQFYLEEAAAKQILNEAIKCKYY